MRRRKLLAPLLIFLATGAVIWLLVWAFGVVGCVRQIVRPEGCTHCPLPTGTPEREGEDGHVTLGAPKPGEWRFSFSEEPQSFEQYRTGPLNYKCAHRTTFYLQPLGDAATQHQETLDRMRLYAEAFFGVPAKVLDPIPEFEAAYAKDRDQYDADQVIRLLSKQIPKDALVYMGISGKDLYAPGLNFVFGVGSRTLRTGAYSLTRFRTADKAVFTRRSLDLLSHEAGHIVSIDHCVTYACVMQGANSLAESDRHPMHLCPADLQKVLWNTGLDRRERYKKLLPLYQKWGCTDEAAWVSAQLERP